jgi:hypothetical protein
VNAPQTGTNESEKPQKSDPIALAGSVAARAAYGGAPGSEPRREPPPHSPVREAKPLPGPSMALDPMDEFRASRDESRGPGGSDIFSGRRDISKTAGGAHGKSHVRVNREPGFTAYGDGDSVEEGDSEDNEETEEAEIVGDAEVTANIRDAMETIPKKQRATMFYKFRQRKPAPNGRTLLRPVGEFSYSGSKGDAEEAQAEVCDELAKFGPGTYIGSPYTMDGKPVKNGTHWKVTITEEEARTVGWRPDGEEERQTAMSPTHQAVQPAEPAKPAALNGTVLADENDIVKEAAREEARIRLLTHKLQTTDLENQLEQKRQQGKKPEQQAAAPAQNAMNEDSMRKLLEAERARIAAEHRAELAQAEADRRAEIARLEAEREKEVIRLKSESAEERRKAEESLKDLKGELSRKEAEHAAKLADLQRSLEGKFGNEMAQLQASLQRERDKEREEREREKREREKEEARKEAERAKEKEREEKEKERLEREREKEEARKEAERAKEKEREEKEKERERAERDRERKEREALMRAPERKPEDTAVAIATALGPILAPLMTALGAKLTQAPPTPPPPPDPTAQMAAMATALQPILSPLIERATKQPEQPAVDPMALAQQTMNMVKDTMTALIPKEKPASPKEIAESVAAAVAAKLPAQAGQLDGFSMADKILGFSQRINDMNKQQNGDDDDDDDDDTPALPPPPPVSYDPLEVTDKTLDRLKRFGVNVQIGNPAPQPVMAAAAPEEKTGMIREVFAGLKEAAPAFGDAVAKYMNARQPQYDPALIKKFQIEQMKQSQANKQKPAPGAQKARPPQHAAPPPAALQPRVQQPQQVQQPMPQQVQPAQPQVQRFVPPQTQPVAMRPRGVPQGPQMAPQGQPKPVQAQGQQRPAQAQQPMPQQAAPQNRFVQPARPQAPQQNRFMVPQPQPQFARAPQGAVNPNPYGLPAEPLRQQVFMKPAPFPTEPVPQRVPQKIQKAEVVEHIPTMIQAVDAQGRPVQRPMQRPQQRAAQPMQQRPMQPQQMQPQVAPSPKAEIVPEMVPTIAQPQQPQEAKEELDGDGLPTYKSWGDLCAYATSAIEKNSDPEAAALHLLENYPKAADLVTNVVASVGINGLDGLLTDYAMNAGAYAGVIGELASRIRNEPGRGWAGRLVTYLKGGTVAPAPSNN